MTGTPGVWTKGQLDRAKKRVEAVEKLPALFTQAQASARGYRADYIQEMLADGLLRKQGRAYYKPDAPPTVDQVMMVDSKLTMDELEDMSVGELLTMLKEGKCMSMAKRNEIRELVGDRGTALDFFRTLYNNINNGAWAEFVEACNRINI